MSVVVIHRGNRRQPWDALRLCRRHFPDEAAALEFAWRKARAGALMVRGPPAAMEVCVPRKPSQRHDQRWRPATEFIRHGTVHALELLVADGLDARAEAVFTAEGGFSAS